MKAIILLSGGIDSMSCINFYKDLGYKIKTIFYDYGQPAAKYEALSAFNISKYFSVPFEYIKMADIDIQNDGEIVGRNALLIIQTLSKCKIDNYKIILGIHNGTNYADCSLKFINKINDIMDLYTYGQTICESPFINWFKEDIIEYAKSKNLPIYLTYSCENGTNPPCGKCLSCLSRKELLNE
ncbi:MAG: tRNA methyl transferase-like protein [Eubacteriaceae bacterium]|nr:tRNA methyl transferase-like protein [Eubacteriaceae bacterium]